MLRWWACMLRLPLDTSCGSGSVAVGSRTVAFPHFADTFVNAALASHAPHPACSGPHAAHGTSASAACCGTVTTTCSVTARMPARATPLRMLPPAALSSAWLGTPAKPRNAHGRGGGRCKRCPHDAHNGLAPCSPRGIAAAPLSRCAASLPASARILRPCSAECICSARSSVSLVARPYVA